MLAVPGGTAWVDTEESAGGHAEAPSTTLMACVRNDKIGCGGTSTPIMETRRGNRRRSRRAINRTLVTVGVLVLGAAGAFGLLLLATPPAARATALARAQARANGIKYPGPKPPCRFTEALVATEDHRFYSPIDPGIDPFAIGRVILGRITGLRGQGGSTIDQQLAKMLYTPGRSGRLTVDLEQIAIAVKLHFTYTRAQILALYAEVAYFGNGYYGLAAASHGYFGRSPENLTWAQAATLAGVINAPSADNPCLHPQSAHAREVHVFRRLVAVGDLSKAQAVAALSQPLGLTAKGANGIGSCSYGGPQIVELICASVFEE